MNKSSLSSITPRMPHMTPDTSLITLSVYFYISMHFYRQAHGKSQVRPVQVLASKAVGEEGENLA